MSTRILSVPVAPTGLEEFKGLHCGERCFVIGCAPSLRQLDLSRLRDEWAFTVNRGYLAASYGLARTPYFVVSDPHTYAAYWQEIRRAYVGRRFYRADVCDLPAYREAADREPAVCFPFHRAPSMDEGHFAEDATQGTYRGFTVVLDAVQLAFLMGFSEVYIIGCDLNYQASQTHFYGTGNYEQNRINDMPIAKVLKSMSVASEVFRRHGRILANAGVSGHLDAIPRVNYESLFPTKLLTPAAPDTTPEEPTQASPESPSAAATSGKSRFVSFLLPFIDRNQGPLYRWVMQLQAAHFRRDELVLIGDDRYFQPPLDWGQEAEFFGFPFRYPQREEWEQVPKYSLSHSVFADLERRTNSMLEAFRILLTEDYPPLREALEDIFAELCRTKKPDAILSWCHVPSLKRAAAQFGIPVIHNELGPLRPPLYRSTVYFDFNGVNGFTSASEQMHRFAREAAGWKDFQPLSLVELRELFIVAPEKQNPVVVSDRFPVGAALQVEDDSNLLAFSKGLTNFDLIFSARKGHALDQVLIRQHPHGYARYSEKLGTLDSSPDAIEFLSRCEQVFTINSSVAFECLLQDKPVTVLGDSPAAGLSRERLAAMPEAKRLLCLNWLFVGYLVPASRLFDADYYRWRLTQPTLREIHERHLEMYRAALPANALQKALDQSVRFFQADDLPQAVREAERAVQIAPGLANAHALLAILLVQQGRLKAAEASARQALALESDHLNALRLLAALLKQRSSFEEGAALYARIAKLVPGDIDALLGNAACSAAQGHKVLAEMLLEEALEKSPNHAGALELQRELQTPGTIEKRNGHATPAPVLQVAEKPQPSAPMRSKPAADLVVRAREARDAGHHVLASLLVEEALEVIPDDPRAVDLANHLQRLQGAPAVSRAPQLPVHRGLQRRFNEHANGGEGRIPAPVPEYLKNADRLLKAGAFVEAAQACLSVLQTSPDDLAALALLGQCFAKLDQEALANEAFLLAGVAIGEPDQAEAELQVQAPAASQKEIALAQPRGATPSVSPEAQQRSIRVLNRALNVLKMTVDPATEAMPSWVNFQTTFACNLRCPHCQTHGTDEAHAHFQKLKMSPETLRSSAAQTLPWAHSYSLSLNGEPLVTPGWPDLFEEYGKYGARLDLTTNGTLLNAKTLPMLVPHLERLCISMDGATAATCETLRRGASYARLLESIHLTAAVLKETATERTVPLELAFTIMGSNVHELPDMVALAHRFGVRRLSVYPVIPFSDRVKNFESLERHKARYNRFLREAQALARQHAIQLTAPPPFAEDAGTPELAPRPEKLFVTAPAPGTSSKQDHFGPPNGKASLAAIIGSTVAEVKSKLTSQAHQQVALSPDTADRLYATLRSLRQVFMDLSSDRREVWSCEFLTYRLYIAHNGDVAPCCVPGRPTLGNVSKTSVHALWNGEAYQQFRQKFVSASPGHPCGTCSWRRRVTLREVAREMIRDLDQALMSDRANNPKEF